MRHSWGKRSWWQALGGSSTQTCRRCGAKLKVVRQAKLLPGRRRPRAKIARLYQDGPLGGGLIGFWPMNGAVPPCPGPASVSSGSRTRVHSSP
jgi:hypothetical protein